MRTLLNCINLSVYIDDGYSGTNFDRPGFKKMISDIETGKINCVITKDLSRLGRNYLEVGIYTEIFFPEHGIRYIALNDNVDTSNAQSLDFAPFRNLLNDMYAKDISKKIKSAILTRQKQGQFFGRLTPFGYKKDIADKHHLVIDEKNAVIVRKIFEYAKNGLGVVKIIKIFEKEKVMRPEFSAYNKISGSEAENNLYSWSSNTIRTILSNPVYIGDLVCQKYSKISIKTKKKLKKGSVAFTVKNCHEAIISPEDFELVQNIRKNKKYETKSQYENIFSGLLKCFDCQKGLTAKYYKSQKHKEIIDSIGYQCSTYRLNGKTACSMHWIRAKDLYNAVLADIKKHAALAKCDETATTKEIFNLFSENHEINYIKSEKEISEIKKRLNEINKIFLNLYEDKINSKISEYN